MKKVPCIMLSLLLAIGLLGGCAGGGGSSASGSAPPAQGSSGSTPAPTPTGTSDRTNKVTISVAMWDAEFADDALAEAVKEELNVDFDLRPLSWDNPEQVSLFGATDSLPDVVATYPANELPMFYSWIDQGLIRDIPYEMIAKYPLLKEIVDNDVVLNAIGDIKGGKIWYLPRPESYTNLYKANTSGLYFRKDWMENVGITKVPTTADELYELLKAFKEQDPDGNGLNDTIPLSTQKFVPDQPEGLFFGYWGVDPLAWYKQDDGNWVPGYYSDAMLEPLQFYRKLYEEGLLDPEFTTVSRNQMLQLFAAGSAGAIIRNCDADWVNKVVHRSFYSANPDLDPFEAVALMPPLAAEAGKQPMVAEHLDLCGSYISSKVDDEKLDRILDWMNWSLTEEARMMYRYGFEGVDYDMVNGVVEQRKNDDGTRVYAYPSTHLGNIATWDFDYAADVNQINDFLPGVKEMANEYRENAEKYVFTANLTARFMSTPAKDELQITPGDKYMQIIIGTEDVETMFRAFQQECDNLGMKDAIAEVTAEMAKLGE